MNIYYLEAAKQDGIVHGQVFTTEKLAIAYGNEFSGLMPYAPLWGWRAPATKKTAMRLRVASLRVD